MALIDQQYLKTPFYGSRRMTAWLRNHGHQVNRKRVRRLMQLIGLEAIYRRPNTSKPNPGHKVYPYLLRGLEINRVNQVWATDITYIPMGRGFLYLVAIMDWHSRVRAGLAAVQHPGGRLLCCGSGRGLEQGSATDLQHRPGQPVHQRGLHHLLHQFGTVGPSKYRVRSMTFTPYGRTPDGELLAPQGLLVHH